MKSASCRIISLMAVLLFSSSGYALVNWTQNATLPGVKTCKFHHGKEVCLSEGNRSNIYKVDNEQLEKNIYSGAKHALYYPVEVTELNIPYKALEKFFDNSDSSPIRRFFYKIAKKISKFNSFEDIYSWLGLHNYPQKVSEQGPNLIPFMGPIENDPMGVTVYQNKSKAMTFSCAACHSSDLFGTKVLGLTNRFPRANEFFLLGQKVLKKTPAFAYKALFNADDYHMQLLKKTKDAINYVGVKSPLVLGLDTSLAQVAMSLAKRKNDEYATREIKYAKNPRFNELSKTPADSKPAVWWNLKYKTRWLSDGSIISGNPIHTNFLWNEIGRGVDLKKLENWLIDNKKTIKELTSYVFATKAPLYNNFFPGEINIAKAKKGQKLFLKNCSGCHGEYQKGWDHEFDSYEDQIKTTNVHYHTKTPVINVGTDPHRHQGMKYFAKELNRLKISKTIGTIVEPQNGYVPPPLVGIWSRWPYFHNNSVPTLYDVITPDNLRPKSYIATASLDKEVDFDKQKNGYPAPELIRAEFRNDKEFYYDTTIKGLSNSGHTKMLLDDEGRQKFSHEQKLQIIEFLKTL